MPARIFVVGFDRWFENRFLTTRPESPAETTWIEIELLDPDGKPVSDERFKITMPDGSIQYGRLDSNGKAKIERLQPGSCQVTFPDRDQEVWTVG